MLHMENSKEPLHKRIEKLQREIRELKVENEQLLLIAEKSGIDNSKINLNVFRLQPVKEQ